MAASPRWILRWSGRDERSVGVVPMRVGAGVVLLLFAQVAFRLCAAPPVASAQALTMPPSEAALRVAALGEPLALARGLNLWLQAFDHQPGVSIPYSRLDYVTVRAWLDRIVALDPAGQYPFLAATRLYGALRQPEKQRMMLQWVYERYPVDPSRRWRWLAHAALIAKYQLDDLSLALKFAKRLTQTDPLHPIPFWARDLSVLVLEDQCELDAARILVGGLLAQGHLRDGAERRFLEHKLKSMGRTDCALTSGRQTMQKLGLTPTPRRSKTP